jgi:uncharacterized protein
MKPINLRIAEELSVREQQVAAAISLLDGGATVPFVARYRKEATGALDDAQLRTLQERLSYLRELDERRAAILDSIGQQGKLDAALKQAIDAADSKARLEDLYLPYRPRRRTKAQIAREAGLEPLAEALLARPDRSPEQVARQYVDVSKGVIDPPAALEGARAIVVERFSEDATLIGTLREEVWSRGHLCSRVRAAKAELGAKFSDYFEFSEPLTKLPIGTIPCMPAEVGRGAIRVYFKGAVRREPIFNEVLTRDLTLRQYRRPWGHRHTSHQGDVCQSGSAGFPAVLPKRKGFSPIT